MSAPIALLTDFGHLDPYVGIMKGVIRARATEVTFLDLTHEIPPGDVLRAAVVLWQSYRFFPPGTVFLVVVDPGVGTARRPVLVESGGYRFVGPDNGVFSLVLEPGWQAWELANPLYRLEQVSTTFHGRDIFAPAAAHAALGVPGEAFGPPVTDLVRLQVASPREREDGVLEGQVLYADRFGNLLTNLGVFQEAGDGTWRFRGWPQPRFDRRVRLQALELPDGRRLPWVTTFGQLPPGEAGFLVGSTGLVEIVVNRGSAAERFGLGRGEPVRLFVEPLVPLEPGGTA